MFLFSSLYKNIIFYYCNYYRIDSKLQADYYITQENLINTIMLTSMFSLPPEIVWSIVSLLKPADLSNTRLVCKKFKAYCDCPANWKHILLEPPLPKNNTVTCNGLSQKDESNVNVEEEAIPLWNILDLKKILEPHLLFIQTIKIWGIRDNIIRYLILKCPHLTELTILGWSTLSDHALRIPAQPNHALPLRRLRLIGSKKANFTSLDAITFGNLIARCPHLEELSVICCQVHIQAESLIDSFDSTQQRQQTNESSHDVSSLRSLTVATKRTWSKQHVTRLFQLCSNLCFLALVPDSKQINEQAGKETASKPVMNNNEPVLEKNTLSVDDVDIKEANNIIIYSS